MGIYAWVVWDPEEIYFSGVSQDAEEGFNAMVECMNPQRVGDEVINLSASPLADAYAYIVVRTGSWYPYDGCMALMEKDDDYKWGDPLFLAFHFDRPRILMSRYAAQLEMRILTEINNEFKLGVQVLGNDLVFYRRPHFPGCAPFAVVTAVQ